VREPKFPDFDLTEVRKHPNRFHLKETVLSKPDDPLLLNLELVNYHWCR